MAGEIAQAVRNRAKRSTLRECVEENAALDGSTPSACDCIYNDQIAGKFVRTIPVNATKTTVALSLGACGYADFREDPTRLTLEVYREGLDYTKADPLIDTTFDEVHFGQVVVVWGARLEKLCSGRLIGFILLDKCRVVGAFRFALGSPYGTGEVCHTVPDVPECLDNSNRDDVEQSPIADPCCDANDCAVTPDTYDCPEDSDCKGC